MIIATAGHVDHGKTSLVKALSGIDTDSLPEERVRGLTVDIGFAYLQGSDNQRLAVIDVPGHEKFVRNMIAGVGVVDIALLVVAADDGPMPQTLEHIAILKLMAVRKVVPVISKIDLVDVDRVAEVSDLVIGLLHTANLGGAKPFCLSANDSSAVSVLRKQLLKLAGLQTPRRSGGYFRLAIDRCFTVEGSGTVVTGTVAHGSVSKGDTVNLVSVGSSDKLSARVRGLHAQNQESHEATMGQRCALNLSGQIPKPYLHRGCWLLGNADPVATSFVDVKLTPALFTERYHSGLVTKVSNPLEQNLRHWTSAHFHIGTADIPCRIALLDCTELGAGQSGLARIICQKNFAAKHGDLFVLRDQSARKTIAGGKVLDPLPPKRGRGKPARLLELAALDVNSPEQALNNFFDMHSVGVDLKHFVRQFDLTTPECDKIVRQLGLIVVSVGQSVWGLRETQSAMLKEKLVSAIQSFHQDHPEELGVEINAIQQLLPERVVVEVLEHQLAMLLQAGVVVRRASIYGLKGHQVSLSDGDEDRWRLVERQLLATGMAPARVAELAASLERSVPDTNALLQRFVAHGKVYKVTPNRYFLPQTLRALADIAVSLSDNENFTVSEFRNESGIGRNLVVELLEYFDRVRFTVRMGDKRRVLCAAEERFS